MRREDDVPSAPVVPQEVVEEQPENFQTGWLWQIGVGAPRDQSEWEVESESVRRQLYAAGKSRVTQTTGFNGSELRLKCTVGWNRWN